MFPLFHLAVPLFISEIPYIRKKFMINRFALLFGALIPDIIDKLLYFLGIGPGRYICHSLLFLFGSSLIIFLFTLVVKNLKLIEIDKNSYTVTFSYLLGISIHFILDLPKIPLFYPFISYIPISLEGDKLAIWINRLFTNPIYITTELTGAFIIIFIIVKYKLYYPKQMWNYLILTQ